VIFTVAMLAGMLGYGMTLSAAKTT
jgi:hypothetical protein